MTVLYIDCGDDAKKNKALLQNDRLWLCLACIFPSILAWKNPFAANRSWITLNPIGQCQGHVPWKI
jgi:hypothetical protein